jgi:hypothetical protein
MVMLIQRMMNNAAVRASRAGRRGRRPLQARKSAAVFAGAAGLDTCLPLAVRFLPGDCGSGPAMTVSFAEACANPQNFFIFLLTRAAK